MSAFPYLTHPREQKFSQKLLESVCSRDEAGLELTRKGTVREKVQSRNIGTYHIRVRDFLGIRPSSVPKDKIPALLAQKIPQLMTATTVSHCQQKLALTFVEHVKPIGF